jgi:hypothetical protein
MTTKKNRSKRATLPRVGDQVRFTWGLSEWTGQVIEYRGALGINGEHIFAVRFPLTDNNEGEEKCAELPAERLNVIKQAA